MIAGQSESTSSAASGVGSGAGSGSSDMANCATRCRWKVERVAAKSQKQFINQPIDQYLHSTRMIDKGVESGCNYKRIVVVTIALTLTHYRSEMLNIKQK